MNNSKVIKGDDGYLYALGVVGHLEEDSHCFDFIRGKRTINQLWFGKNNFNYGDGILGYDLPIIRILNKDGRMLQLEPDMSGDLLIRFVDEIESEEDVAELF